MKTYLYWITVFNGSTYLAIRRPDGYHFTDGAGWVDPDPVPDEIVKVRDLTLDFLESL